MGVTLPFARSPDPIFREPGGSGRPSVRMLTPTSFGWAIVGTGKSSFSGVLDPGGAS